jgi:acetyltransferase EpsM
MRIVIIGSGGHAAVVADILWRMREAGDDVEPVAFVDDAPRLDSPTLCDLPVVAGGLAVLPAVSHDAVVIAIGNNTVRSRMTEELRRHGRQLATARHPSSVIARDVQLGCGTVICAGAVINPGARIGVSVIVNSLSAIEHHNQIGDAAHIAPGVRLGGHVTVGDLTLVGIGSTVLPQTRIGARTVVGAGSVVVRDIPDDSVAYGVPARVRGGPGRRTHLRARHMQSGQLPTLAHDWNRGGK